ncbi:MAG: hypothetical protein U0232_13920 [Thermomicrobiales bacterium]
MKRRCSTPNWPAQSSPPSVRAPSSSWWATPTNSPTSAPARLCATSSTTVASRRRAHNRLPPGRRERHHPQRHRIRLGEPPELSPPAALGHGTDCIFVPAPPDRVAAIAAEWAAERLPRHLGRDPRDVQTCPLTRVCQALNAALRDRLNPPRPGRTPARCPHRRRPRHRTRNNYTLGVVNGATPGSSRRWSPARSWSISMASAPSPTPPPT